MWFEGVAWAEAAHPAAPAAPPNFMEQLLTGPTMPLVLVMGIVYFLIIRPQTKKASDHQKLLGALKRNDEVVTGGGLVGRISELGERLITLEIAPGVKVRVEKQQIVSLSTYGKTPKKEKGDS